MISNQERIKIIKKKLTENGGIIPLNAKVSVQEKCRQSYHIGNIYLQGKSVLLNIVGPTEAETEDYATPPNKKIGDTLNIREIRDTSVLHIMWRLLAEKEKAQIALDHLYSCGEYEVLRRL